MTLTPYRPQGPDLGDIPPGVSYGPNSQLYPSLTPDSEGIPWGRYFDVVKRHVLMISVIVVAGSLLGVVAARRVHPIYDAQSTVWIASQTSPQSGPIRPQQLLPATSWVELMRSYAIVDPVVRELRLNVSPKISGDSIYFRSFESLPTLHPGAYVLKVEGGGRYTLSTAKGLIIERGLTGDSIGRKIGIAWIPDAKLLKPGRVLEFNLTAPRTTSLALLSTLRTTLPDDGQFLTITLSGSDPNRTATILNAWVEQFVESASSLKKRHLLEFKKLLSDQLSVAETQLRTSESRLENFRVNTITLPSGGNIVATGTATTATPDPSVTAYFQQRGTLDDVQQERVALEQIVAGAQQGPIDPQSFIMLPTILNDAPQLRAALEELSSRQASLRTERQFLTDANPRIVQLNGTIRALQYETIPRIVQNVLQTLRLRERELNQRLETRSAELKGIPARAIEEARLVRQVSASENLYNVLKARFEEVSLAEAQTTPDLSILDYALPPTHPNSNDAPRLILLAILASIGFAAALSLLHDRMDSRFRYPEQATRELGLTISGTVPKLRASRSGDFQVEQMSQVVEAFRTLRLAMRYEFPHNRPVKLTVSSPSTGDGKSLVSSNLALAFASAGHRTLLVDGDVRCGSLHSTFASPVTPGLVEYLSDGIGMDTILRSTAFENLYLVPRGTRSNRAPELLVSDRMAAFVARAGEQFDVVIIDSPPFVAGVDAYALAAATGNILVVLRQGLSDRKLAGAKLTVLDRLPIRVLGVVINGVPSGGMYRYYGTDYAGGSVQKPAGNIATPHGLVMGA